MRVYLTNFHLQISPKELKFAVKTGPLSMYSENPQHSHHKWKERFVVLQGEFLYVYKDPKDSKATAAIKVTDYRLDPLTQKHKRKFTFELIGASKSYAFTAKTAEELKEWGEKILAAAKANVMEKEAYTNIFGGTLSAAVSKQDGSEIPTVVTKIIQFLDKPGLSFFSFRTQLNSIFFFLKKF